MPALLVWCLFCNCGCSGCAVISYIGLHHNNAKSHRSCLKRRELVSWHVGCFHVLLCGVLLLFSLCAHADLARFGSCMAHPVPCDLCFPGNSSSSHPWGITGWHAALLCVPLLLLGNTSSVCVQLFATLLCAMLASSVMLAPRLAAATCTATLTAKYLNLSKSAVRNLTGYVASAAVQPCVK